MKVYLELGLIGVVKGLSASDTPQFQCCCEVEKCIAAGIKFCGKHPRSLKPWPLLPTIPSVDLLKVLGETKILGAKDY